MKFRKRILALLLTLALMIPVSAAENRTVRIAVIDSGISTTAISPDSVAEGHNYALPSSSTEDIVGHGTAIASIIVGCESAGITGLCPEATLVPLVIYSRNENQKTVRCDEVELATVIRDAVDVYDCDIINMSLTTRLASPELEAAVTYAWQHGVLVVTSAGNDGGATVLYPGGFDTTLCVGSSNESGTGRASFSNFNTFLDILAPGVNLPIAKPNGTADTGSGTSYSTAYISGVAAKLMLAYPNLTAEQILQLLLASADDLRSEGRDNLTGWGVLNLNNAMQYAEQGRQFRDAPPSQWYFEGVKYMSAQGLMKGTDAINFSPNDTTTRAMMWVMLYRMDEQEENGACESWYSEAQNWVKTNAIADGEAPNQIITREEIASILYAYSRYKGFDISKTADLSSYSDYTTVSEKAAAAMCWACGCGIINGMDGALNPQGSATRAQIATMLMRFAKL